MILQTLVLIAFCTCRAADQFYTEFTTWEILCFIIGGTFLLCTVILSSYWYFRRRKGTRLRHYSQNEDSVCDPILGGNTIHDIIEMTTSGSGSGIPICYI